MPYGDAPDGARNEQIGSISIETWQDAMHKVSSKLAAISWAAEALTQIADGDDEVAALARSIGDHVEQASNILHGVCPHPRQGTGHR